MVQNDVGYSYLQNLLAINGLFLAQKKKAQLNLQAIKRHKNSKESTHFLEKRLKKHSPMEENLKRKDHWHPLGRGDAFLEPLQSLPKQSQQNLVFLRSFLKYRYLDQKKDYHKPLH